MQMLLLLLQMLGTDILWPNIWSDSVFKYTVNFPIISLK